MAGNIVQLPVQYHGEKPKKERERRRGERKDGRIQRSWSFTNLETGLPDRKYFYGTSGTDADRQKEAYKKAYYERKAEIERKQKELEEMGPMAEYVGCTVDEWIPAWRNKYKKKQGIKNKQTYDAILARISRHIGKMKLADVREFHILDIFNELEGFSESMIRKVLFILKSLFEKARINKVIKENPMSTLNMDDLPEGTAGTHRALERWERDLIFKWATYHRALTWGASCILTGMRSGEIAALDCKNVLLDARQLKILDTVTYESNQPIKQDQTKTEAGMRVVPICDLLYTSLSLL